jgi:hypothetical protein
MAETVDSQIMSKTDEGYLCNFAASRSTMRLTKEYLKINPQFDDAGRYGEVESGSLLASSVFISTILATCLTLAIYILVHR